MRRMITVVATMVVLAAGMACAQTDLDEADYQNIDKLHNKIIRMKREMDHLMKDILSTYPTQTGVAAGVFGQDVKVDVMEGDKMIDVKADLPGMEKDKIDITLDKNKFLKISGTRDVLKKEEKPGAVIQERMSGHFERVIELPAECLSSGINATYKNGVLDISIPKKKEGKEEQVKIQVM